MQFLWDENNTRHLARHGVDPQLAEAVFRAGQDDIHGASLRWRFVLEAEVDGSAYRLFFDRTTQGDAIYPVTCYPF